VKKTKSVPQKQVLHVFSYLWKLVGEKQGHESERRATMEVERGEKMGRDKK
jgi:hypothetical protein